MLDFFVKTSVDGDLVLTTSGTIALCAVFVLILVLASLTFKKNTQTKISTKQLVFCSIAMALALITSYIELYSFIFGGSITLFSMAFICIIGYLYGARISIPVAIAYGLLQFLIKPYIVHPSQILLDYPLAFGALGLSGLFYKSKHGLLKGYFVGIIGRWVFSSISGYIFYSEWAWDGWNPLAYTLVYNGAYIFAEAAITMILLVMPVVFEAITQVKKMACED